MNVRQRRQFGASQRTMQSVTFGHELTDWLYGMKLMEETDGEQQGLAVESGCSRWLRELARDLERELRIRRGNR